MDLLHKAFTVIWISLISCEAATGLMPFCPDEREMADGTVIYKLEGKSFLSQSQLTEGIKRRIRCHPGFETVGYEKGTCRGGQWSHDLPLCSPKNCKPLRLAINNYAKVDYTHDTLLNNKYPHGSLAKVICKPGTFLVAGDGMPVCNAGQWLPNVPYCMEIGPTTEPPEDPNSCEVLHVINGYFAVDYGGKYVENGTIADFICNSNAEDFYDEPVVCTNGEWYPGIPGCREKSCQLPWDTKEVRIESDFNHHHPVWHGYTITFTCIPGYIMRGPSTALCQFGEWTSPLPICEPDASAHFEQCGISGETELRFGGRVVGGIPANEGAWPWMAGIYWQRTDGSWFLFCGGSLIAPGWVLSAGHCFGYDEDVSRLQVRLGLTSRRNDIGSIREQIYNVRNLFMPKQHDFIDFDYDIALLQLNDTARLNPYVRTVCLPPETEPGEDVDRLVRINMFGMVTGWGHSKPIPFNDSSPSVFEDTLQQLQIPIRQRSDCIRSLASVGEDVDQFTPRMFCAGYNRKARDTCFGDSGGPFMRRVRINGWAKRWVQIGIVSAGKGCAVEGQYAFYTHVPKLVGWINRVMRGNHTPTTGELTLI